VVSDVSDELIRHGSKKRQPAIPAKVKTALHHLFGDPRSDLAAAAKAAGITTYRLREAMKRADVRAWAYREKQALVDAICAQNPLALKAIRDSSRNDMAKVAAIKTLEQIGDDEAEPRRLSAPAPGLVIVIEQRDGSTRTVGASPAPPMIEGRRVPEHEFEPAHSYPQPE
jgi:hypothetical protein